MPELPEVHALVTDLRGRLLGRRIARLDLVSFAALKTFDPPATALAGGTVTGVDRHGKFLDLTVATPAHGNLHMLIHLARAGWLRWREAAPQGMLRPGRGPIAVRLVLEEGDGALSTGSGFDLTEAGTKKSLAVWIVVSPTELERIATLGPDPLDPAFTRDTLAEILARAGRSQLKGLLRNQSVIAGIGNAYSDEILHAARLSPFAPATLDPPRIDALYAALRETLESAVARADGLAAADLKGEKKSNLQVHGRTGQACPVCGDTIRQVIYADSTFQYCPTCQTGGKPLADRVLSRLLK